MNSKIPQARLEVLALTDDLERAKMRLAFLQGQEAAEAALRGEIEDLKAQLAAVSQPVNET